MKSRILPSLSLLAALRLFGAETPGDFFHEGATNYVFTKAPEARRAVEAGLQKFPDDRPLQKLLELLKEQENQQPQNDQDQKQDEKKDQQQKPQDQQQKNDPQQGDQKKDQESKKPDPKDAEQKKGSEDKDRKPPEGPQARKPQDQGDPKDPDKAQAGRMSAMQMTPQQAQQLLDAHKGEENIMIFLSPEQKGTNRLRGKIRDW